MGNYVTCLLLGLMHRSHLRRTCRSFKVHLKGSITWILYIHIYIFCINIYSCAVELQPLSFHALSFPLYLCRAAHGSADIPILPHAHTILLKHAVNLRRKRTLFTSKQRFHHPFVLPTSHCHRNIGFSQNSGVRKELRSLCDVISLGVTL